jgi:hypothetical protein
MVLLSQDVCGFIEPPSPFSIVRLGLFRIDYLNLNTNILASRKTRNILTPDVDSPSKTVYKSRFQGAGRRTKVYFNYL